MFPKRQFRFIRSADHAELINLYHLARTALSGSADQSGHARMIWAAGEFAKTHAYVSATGAYKDLSDALTV